MTIIWKNFKIQLLKSKDITRTNNYSLCKVGVLIVMPKKKGHRVGNCISFYLMKYEINKELFREKNKIMENPYA